MTDSEDAALADLVDYLRAQFRQAAGAYGSLIDLEARLKAAKEVAEGREDDATGREGIYEEAVQDSAMDRGS